MFVNQTQESPANDTVASPGRSCFSARQLAKNYLKYPEMGLTGQVQET